MKRPKLRSTLQIRSSDNEKRRLHPTPPSQVINHLLNAAKYQGISKHKSNPIAFGLAPNAQPGGDATKCDEHANFSPEHMNGISALLTRGINAGLIGHFVRQDVPTILWTVADDGWIFEARITNATQVIYHGYPVLSSEAIAFEVYQRFRAWCSKNGSMADKNAADNCEALYGFHS